MSEIKLIYHNKESSEGGLSPFSKTIDEIIKDKNVCIVCPYIGIDYFENIIQLCNSWKLITDINEWIASDNSNAVNIKEFIINNSSNIHHYKDIHAKVIITENNAFVGSSNLTKKGLTHRVEMSVLIENKENLNELQNWFSDLWSNSDSANIQDIEEYVTSVLSMPSNYINKPNYTISSKTPTIKAKLWLESKKNDVESHERLVKVIKLMINREWINSYFDLAKEIIEFTKLKNDDSRLAMSITKNKKIPININQRYILKPYYNGHVGLIMPLEYASQNYARDRVVYEAKDYFFRNKVHVARWLEFERKDKVELSDNIKNHWKKEVLKELERSKISGFRKHHEPIVYEAIMNLSYRKKLLDEAFPKNHNIR